MSFFQKNLNHYSFLFWSDHLGFVDRNTIYIDDKENIKKSIKIFGSKVLKTIIKISFCSIKLIKKKYSNFTVFTEFYCFLAVDLSKNRLSYIIFKNS